MVKFRTPQLTPFGPCPVELQAQECKLKRTEWDPLAEVRPEEGNSWGERFRLMQVVGDPAFWLLSAPESERKGF